ncbi:MAG TPA: bifunctional adenosylcobinamide kinase/adenosylcobinamide-phosphate guanylyltransferase [Desulfobacteraceae bacterium]|nr:bifunctional adenosylcobinamide kinase/adenosylcobinamide-phosphate guanylyltransferase [Desulfobacteraceae bacterium]
MNKDSGNTTLVIGGCRSGKSRYALDAANRTAKDNKIYLATSVPTDPEMENRVARHQAERGPDWRTVEEPVLIHEAIRGVQDSASVVLVDCLTLWTSNLLFRGADEAGVMAAVDKLSAVLVQVPCPVYLVTNEVGYGIVPENSLARQFRDMAGLVNQRVAAVADRVILTVAGIDVQIKPNTLPDLPRGDL